MESRHQLQSDSIDKDTQINIISAENNKRKDIYTKYC